MKKHILLLGFALVAARATRAQNAIGEVFSSDAGVRGSVILSGNGTRVLSGSQVSAGDGIALLKLERGGEVRICPKTSLSFSSDPSGKALVLGLNTGSMELNYSLRAASDSLITPDFRLQLISPGDFHFAIAVLPSGDTCLRSMPGNNAAIFITEMMSSESYQLSPGKDVLFRAGKISGATGAPPVCGCLEAKREMLRANVPSPPIPTPAPPPIKEFFPSANPAGEPHLEADSSFVYRGNGVTEDYYLTVARLAVSRDNSRLALALIPKVSGPAQASEAPKKKQGILNRIGGFLGRLFQN